MQSPSRDLAVTPAGQNDLPSPSMVFRQTSQDPAEDEGGLSSCIYGACSAETYRAAGSLHAAHRDAGGFLDGVDRFSTPEFWRRDDAVKSWIYRGPDPQAAVPLCMDGVRVFYHSGHGGTDDDGQFRLPMGAMWNGTDASIGSQDMQLGADRLRYLFWSASESLRLRDGHAPTRAWAGANAGLRMMFGFDSVCWDSDRQGAEFWRHWEMGKSLSQSWLDASAEVSTDQIASVCAMAETAEGAVSRLFDERRFSPERGAPTWWAWRWTQSLAEQHHGAVTAVPGVPRCLRLLHPQDDLAMARTVLRHVGIEPGTVPLDRAEGVRLTHDGLRFLRDARGDLLLEYAAPARGTRGVVSLHRRALIARARAALRQHGVLAGGVDLAFDRILISMSAGVGLGARREVLPQVVDDLIVQFRQCFHGISVLSPDSGWVRVVMRSDGSLMRIETRLRSLAHDAQSASGPAARDPNPHSSSDKPDVSHLLARQSALLLRDLAARGAAPLTPRILPGLTEIGYAIRSNTARLVARQGVEITCVRGFRKRYWIQSDLGD